MGVAVGTASRGSCISVTTAVASLADSGSDSGALVRDTLGLCGADTPVVGSAREAAAKPLALRPTAIAAAIRNASTGRRLIITSTSRSLSSLGG